ncbi:TonB-dependent receptor [Seongchinamella sediminis]|uniref:TonB-dependent receptor n=1 Tax=Seongchinamella sediminis TaxID=2283635 RepID=A0A3L7E1E1_9GAMM|nr:TonB-dependent receptor [Seongchinamella sediminis]RLQ21952.1 TonB-dependent receptor [Seongchinamella sediminis]
MTSTPHFRRVTPAWTSPLSRAVKSALLIVGASAVATPALAQDEPRQSRYNLQLEEVLVTAQKREEDFMSVPGAVNAFTSQDMVNTGAATIQDIDAFMPGVEIGDAVGGSTQLGITVRGVSSPNISSGQDPSVATFYDGSYMPRAVTSIPFTDIARTEVLKGPQGTLFGRNATAGVINIVPNKPHADFEGFAKARLGTNDLVRVEGMVNAPLTDDLFLRANVFSNQRSGNTGSATNGGDYRDEGYWAARGVLLWEVGEDTEIQLAADYEDRDEMPRATIGVSKYAYQGSDKPFRSKDQHDVVGDGSSYDNRRNNEEETREMYGVSLKVEHNFSDQWSMFGLVSYRDWETTNLEEEDGTPDPRRYLDTNNIEDSDIFYSEVRFNYVDKKINLITGANYSEEDVFQRTDIGLLADSYMQFLTILGGFGGPDVIIWDLLEGAPEEVYLALSAGEGIAVLPPSLSGTYMLETMDNTGDFVNWGVFVDGSYQLTDSIRVAAGLRYSYDEKEYSWQTYESALNWPFAPERVNYNPAETGAPEEDWFDRFVADDDWSKTTGRLVVDWQFTDYAMTYASVATGYKSGGFDGQSFKSFTTGAFDPEEMTSYEIGIKGDFFANSLRTELALFHHELDGRQRSTDIKEGPDDPTAAPGVISSDEETDGIELIVTWNISDSLRVAGLTTYRETESISEEYYNAAGELSGGDKTQSESNTEYTLKLDWTPEIAYGYLLLHMNYQFLEDPGPDENTAVFATGPWYFQDRKYLNARLAWSNADDSIEVALWGNNLLDEEYASNPGGLAADTLGAYHTTPEDTLTWGLDLRYSF